MFGRDPRSDVPQIGHSSGLDFLDRLASAESRDSDRLSSRQRKATQKGHKAYARRHQDGGLMEEGGIVFGDDQMPQGPGTGTSDMYQTSNSYNNAKMQEQHEEAVQRHHENTIRQLLIEQHGLTRQQAEHELKLWKQEVDNGKAKPIPTAEPQMQMEGRRARGENGQFISSASVEDPFKVRAVRSATPPKPKPWDVAYDPGKQRTGSSPPQKKVQAWDVADPFKQRVADVRSPGGNMSRAAAGGSATNPLTNTRMMHAQSNFHYDPNTSSLAGGIFA